MPRHYLMLLACILLTACNVPVTPESSAVSMAVDATLTALAPIPGPSATLALAPVPSASPAPTVVPSSTPLPTPLPTATAAVPEGWTEHRKLDYGWRFHLPPSWLFDDDHRGMSIVLPDERRMILEETPWLCEGTENAVLQCAIEAALSGFGDSYHDFALVDARALPAGQHTLYVVDHTIEMDAVDGLSWRFSVMHASLSYAPGRALHTYIISAPESFPRLTPGGSMSADPLDAATRETCFAILASLAVEPSPTQAVTSNLGQVPVVTPSMASSAATGEPMAVPEGWLEYRTYGGSLSVWYPPQWTIEDEDAHDVSFDVTDRDYAYAAVGAYRTDCVADKDSEDTLRCLTAEILHGASSLDTTRVVSSAVQDTAQGPAFVIEIATKDYVYKSWSATVFVDRIHPSGLIGLNYGRVGVEELTDAERELALEVCDTVRPLP